MLQLSPKNVKTFEWFDISESPKFYIQYNVFISGPGKPVVTHFFVTKLIGLWLMKIATDHANREIPGNLVAKFCASDSIW